MIVGIYLRALPYASIASPYLPATVLAYYSHAAAIYISVLPPPQTTLEFFTVVTNTHNASCNDLSTSSRICDDAPLKIIVHASFLLHPENLITLSSPIIISSIKSQWPRTYSLLSGASNVDKISAPVAAAILSIPSKSACSITVIF